MNYDNLNGPQFLRLCERLPLYEGALRRRLELERDGQEMWSGDDNQFVYDDDGEARQMTMREALARSQNDEQGVLDALNEEGAQAGLGALFERTVIDATE